MTSLQLENKKAAYQEITVAMAGLLAGELTFEAALVSLIALLKEKLPHASWVGLYRVAPDGTLWVGPYQGKLACLRLKAGQGVCGAAASRRETIVVEDVHAFAGHVFCDPLARSEIVVPVRCQGRIIGVLDLDSYRTAAFDAADQQALERLLNSIEPLADVRHT